MAIDTAAKRVSALRQTLPLPDGALTQPDRQHMTWNYGGLLAGAVVEVPAVPTMALRCDALTVMVRLGDTNLVTLERGRARPGRWSSTRTGRAPLRTEDA